MTDKEVLEENYGGEVLNGLLPSLQRNQARAMKRFTNAYMLVYIRETAIDEVLAPFTEDDTPAHLSKRMSVSYYSLMLILLQNDDWMRRSCRLRQRRGSERNNTCS